MLDTSCIDLGCDRQSLYRPWVYSALLVIVCQYKMNDIHDLYGKYIWNLYYGKYNIWLAVGGCICNTVAHFLMKVYYTIDNIGNMTSDLVLDLKLQTNT